MGNSLKMDLEGKIVTINDSYLKDEPCLVVGGFGAMADAMGNALIVKGLWTGFRWRSEGYRVIELIENFEEVPLVPVDDLIETLSKESEANLETLKEVALELGSYLFYNGYKTSNISPEIVKAHKEAHEAWSISSFWYSIALQRKMEEGKV